MTQDLKPSLELALEFGLKEDEYARILDQVGRELTLCELGVYSAMWSEHCSYKSSRVWLKKLPTTGPQVVIGPGENAGAVDIGDNQVAVFKMESHNHPSFIEPYQGAATGVGGIMRDVFTMGARPVANMNALRFGAPDHPKTQHLVKGVVAGIGGYGNCMGVPTVGGETIFHDSYNGNILVNAMCVGVAAKDRIFLSKAAGIGNPVVYVGAKTGRDGIHGATMSSAEFDDNSEEKRPTVQVGDPFTEKLLLEACLELMAKDAIVAIQDMGAAGLTSSSIEMADKGGVGIDLDLDAVPMREEGMTAYELMLSESQERMLMVLKKGHEEEARAIFEKWELDFAIIGAITDTQRLILRRNGQVECDLLVDPLANAAPEYKRPWVETQSQPTLTPGDVAPVADLADALRTLMGSQDIASRRWIWEQYDNMVMADTVGRPGGDAAVVRVHGTNKALAITTDCTPRYCFADPVEGGKQAVAETWRNITAVGGTPLAITDCMNFGNPERPEIMGQFAGCIMGMKEACEALDYPVVSGNVSLYNETKGTGIMPTPAIGGVGLLQDSQRRAHMAFTQPDQAVIVIGDTRGHLGQSLYQREIHKAEAGAPPAVDLAAERLNGDFVRKLIAHDVVQTVHDVADGGLAVALAEMAIAGHMGATIEAQTDIPLHAWLFGEDQARYVLAVDHELAQGVISQAKEAGVQVAVIGATGGIELKISGLTAISLEEMRLLHERWLPDLMAAS